MWGSGYLFYKVVYQCNLTHQWILLGDFNARVGNVSTPKMKGTFYKSICMLMKTSERLNLPG